MSLKNEPNDDVPSQTSPTATPIAWPTLVNFSAPLLPIYALYMMLTVVYMQFATDVLLIAPGIIGTIFFASKIWDAVSDPMVGYLSDKTKSRFGRRKPWMAASILPTVAMVLMLWMPPSSLSGNMLITWSAVSVIGFYTAFTLFAVPQMAYGLELSSSPHERARVFGVRQVSLTLGMLTCFVIATPLITGHPAARENAAWIAAGGAALLAIICALTTWWLPSQRHAHTSRGAASPIAAVRDVIKNPHARLLLFVYFIEVFGIGATSAMTPFLLIYVTKAASYVGLVFLFYTAPALLSIPFWIWMGNRYERHVLWRYAMGLQALGYGTMIFQDEGRLFLMIVSSLINGFATACGQTLGYSIKGDVIDYDEYKTGERKEGSYLAAWSLAAKFGTGLMIAISGWALQFSGFVPNEEQSEVVKWTIKGMIGGAPLICILIGMVAFSRFSLDGAEADRIRAEIARRHKDGDTTPNQIPAV